MSYLLRALDTLVLLIARAFVSLTGIEQKIERISKFASDEFSYFREAIDTVQTRASILLGHISLVLALLALSIGNYSNTPNMLRLFTVLMIAFLFFSVVLLRLVGSVADQSEYVLSLEDYVALMKKECSKRYCIFAFASAGTIFLTVALMIGFVIYPPVSVSWQPH